MNWVFNVLPLGKPALGEFYRKIAGKTLMNAGIALNAEVVRNLEWLVDVIPRAIGIHFVNASHWDDQEADLVLWSDASPCLGLTFVYGDRGFMYPISPSNTKEKSMFSLLSWWQSSQRFTTLLFFIVHPRNSFCGLTASIL